MNWTKIKTWLHRLYIGAEVFLIRNRNIMRLIGIALVIWGSYNLLFAPLMGREVYAPYRAFGMIIQADTMKGFFIGDVLVICLGAVIAWFT